MTRLERIARYLFAAVFVASVALWAVYTIKFNRAKLMLDCTHQEESYINPDMLTADTAKQIRVWCDDFIDNAGRYRGD